MLAIQKELGNVLEDAQRSRERGAQALCERCERLEDKRTSVVYSVTSPISIAPSHSSTGRLRCCSITFPRGFERRKVMGSVRVREMG
jgi:hypothetical protein